MTERVVTDASALVMMLTDNTRHGRWAAERIGGATLLAPHLAVFETANVLRRRERSAAITRETAAQAHRDLLALPIDLWPYDLLASGAWRLRDNLSVYDAAYVALAELTGATLITFDERLAAAPGLPCVVEVPG